MLCFWSAWFFHVVFSVPWGVTEAAVKSEAVLDGNRKEVADRVASFPALLISREPGYYADRDSFP